MKPLFRSLLLAGLLLTVAVSAGAQDFKAQQQKQERSIKAVKKAGKITDLEYEKLMHEQELIRNAIADAEADGVWTSKEKNAVNGKLIRAGRRLRRYQNNNEVY